MSVQGAVAVRSTNQSLASGVETAVVWDAAEFDEGGHWDAGSPTRLTAPADGYYEIGAAGVFPFGATAGQRSLRLRLNGAEFVAGSSTSAAGNSRRLSTSRFLTLRAGDYLEAMAFQDSGAARDFVVEGRQPALWMRKVG